MLYYVAHMRLKVFLAVVGASALSIPALAQVNPPSWWMVNDGNTSCFGWDFLTPADPPVPDFALAPFGSPTWSSFATLDWDPGIFGRTGLWGFNTFNNSNDVDLTLPIAPDSNKVMRVWFQFEELMVFGTTMDCAFEVSPGSSIVNSTFQDAIVGSWRRKTYTFDVVSQPSYLKVTLKSGGLPNFLDAVYIGTHCEVVPEPATMTALASALVLMRRRGRTKTNQETLAASDSQICLDSDSCIRRCGLA
jgi:hypothetical protein